jgi:hypothetical protein
MSLPVIVTRSTCPASTEAMNSLKLRDLAAAWYFVEKFHTRPPTAMRTIQKTALLIVEFTLIPPRTAGFPQYDRSLC